jgi:hypothetical protein
MCAVSILSMLFMDQSNAGHQQPCTPEPSRNSTSGLLTPCIGFVVGFGFFAGAS